LGRNEQKLEISHTLSLLNQNSMEFSDLIQTRQSIRDFLPIPFPEEALENILNAVLKGPSAGNLQAFHIRVIRTPELKERIGLATTACHDPICQAPLSLVFIADAIASGLKYNQRGINLFCLQDATIAATYAMLAATDQGLSTLWVGGFNDQAVIEILALSKGQWPVVIMPIGYPNEKPERRSRRSLQDVIHDPDR
jgi:nitroreductase